MSSSSPLPPLTVHHLHISQSERIVFLCEELQIPYTLKLYHRAPLFAPADLAALTSQRSAPVITTTNPITNLSFNMSESGAIADYINAVFGQSRLSLTPSHENYADYLFFFHFANASLGPAFFRKMSTTISSTLPENPIAKASVQGVHKHLSTINAQLEKTGAYLAGKEFTLADIMSTWSLTTGRQWYQVDLSPYEAILSYLKRVSARESYARTMAKAEEGLDWKVGVTGKGPEMFPAYRELLGGMGLDVGKGRL